MNPLAIFAVSRKGAQLAGRLRLHLGADVYVPQADSLPQGQGTYVYGAGGIRAALAEAFPRYRSIVMVLPVGAAVRLLAPLLVDKRRDPAVVALDEAGAHAIALVSAHLGGANDLARQVAAAVGARPVITTASEVLGSLALDLLGRDWGWTIEDSSGLTRASAALLSGDPVGAYQDAGEEEWWQRAPRNLVRYPSFEALMEEPVAARLVISDCTAFPPPISQSAGRITPSRGERGASVAGPDPSAPPTVVYRPKTLVVGVGCVRGASADEIDELIRTTLHRHGLALASVRELATIEIKRDEPGIGELAGRYGWPVRFFGADELVAAGTPSGPSPAVQRAVGASGVCEPAALRAAGAATLLAPKTRTDRVTVAVARASAGSTAGRLAVVGLGPGAREEVTERALRALEDADAVIGYHGYLDQVRPWLGPKQYHGSAIGEEVDRARLAIALARAGGRVALVSSGDAGIYGTAGIVFELLAELGEADGAAAIEVIPGVSAAQAAAALLGAPLMSDFAAISLSDLMTPWPTIERRLEAAASSDLVIALYNPSSSRRRAQLGRAVEIVLRYRPPETPVGLVRNAYRPGQRVIVTDLGFVLDESVDMLTIVLIGNSATIRIGERLVTRRGYRTEGAGQSRPFRPPEGKGS